MREIAIIYDEILETYRGPMSIYVFILSIGILILLSCLFIRDEHYCWSSVALHDHLTMIYAEY